MNDFVKRKKVISFSQFSNWYSCPFRWKTEYLDGKKLFEESLNMSFGTAIHETMQTYLKALYRKSEKMASRMNMDKYFVHMFERELTKKNIPHTPEEKAEFIEDGKNILKSFRQIDNRLKHFPEHKYKLIDIEHELKLDLKNNIDIVAYLDLVLEEKATGKIKIIDIKTSTNGWNNYQKQDFTKQAQLVLYKALYSKKYNIPLSMIDVEFYIVKRKLYENCAYDQSHIQIFRPSSSKDNVLEVINEIQGFIKECFNPDGTYNKTQKYNKIPGKNKKNCKWCPHLNKNCDGISDV